MGEGGMTDVLPDRAWGIVAVIVAIGSWIVLMKVFQLLIQDDDEESRMDSLTPPDLGQHAPTVSASRGPVQVNVKVIRYEQFHHRRVKGNA
jgi:hypothetical protein